MANRKSASKKIPAEFRQAEKALQLAVDDVIKDHRLRKLPLALWRRGKVVMVAPARLALRRRRHKARGAR